MIIELPIKHTYVPTWGLWEGVREILQNGLDEEQQHNNKLTVDYSPHTECLTVTNQGASMGRAVLLLGETSKAANRELRGHFGEGLNLALLALVRAGHATKVTVPGEVWTPTLGRSEQYNERVLKVAVRKRARAGDSVTVTVENVQEGEWANIRANFLDLCTPSPTRHYGGTYGELVDAPGYAGKVFVKGIYVTNCDDPTYGYNFFYAETDRDRNMIDAGTLTYLRQDVLTGAAERAKQEVLAKVYHSLCNDDQMTNNFSDYAGSTPFRQQIAALFREQHGDKAYPVASFAESQEVSHLGYVGVIVPSRLRNILLRNMDAGFLPLTALREQLALAVKTRHSWADLTTHEQETLAKACRLVQRCARALGHAAAYTEYSLYERVNVVDFHGDLLGLAHPDRKIDVARDQISRFEDAMLVLIHEEAHVLSRAGDGESAHTHLIQDMWKVAFLEAMNGDAT